MAIDGIKAGKVQKVQQIPVAEAPAITRATVLKSVDQALANRVLSEDEVRGLARDLKALSPDDQAAVIERLAAEIKTAHQKGAPVRIQEAALSELSKLPGLKPKLLLDIERARDKTVQHSVTQGLEKTATQVEAKTASDTRNFITEKVTKSHEGKKASAKEFTPEGRLATEVGKQLWSVADGKLDEKLDGGMKAAKDAVVKQAAPIVEKALADLATHPEALGSAKGILDTIMNAAGTAAMNPEAVEAILQQVSRMGPKAASAASKVAAKLGVTLGGEVAKGVAKGVAGTVARDAAKGAAVVGAKGAATAGKALPAIGNAIAVGSTLFAASHFISQLFKRPFDGEKVAKEGLHTLTQAAGIAFPWVALGGDVANLAWGAKIQHSDGKKAEAGQAVTPTADLKEGFGFLSSGADALQAVLHGALGSSGVDPELKARLEATRDRLTAVQNKVKQIEALPSASSEDLQALKKEQSELLASLGDLSSEGLKQAAHDAKREGRTHEASSLEKAGSAAGKIAMTLHRARVDSKLAQRGDADPTELEDKRKTRGSELMDAAADLIGAGADLIRARKARGAPAESSADV